MLRKIFIIVFCLTIAIFFTNISFSQDDPATTDEGVKTEEGTDATNTEGTETVEPEVKPDAKTYTDGKKIFVNPQVKFKLTAKDNFKTDRIEYKIDGGEVKIFNEAFSLDQEGRHTIRYYGVDKIGNKEMEKVFSVLVDNTAPEVVVTNKTPVQKINEKIYISSAMVFDIKAKDSLSGLSKIEYSINGTDFQGYSAPFTIRTVGEIDLKVRAIDNVNNVSKEFTYKLIDATGNEVDVKGGSLKLESDNEPPVIEIKPDKELKKSSYMNIAGADVKYTVTAKDDKSGLDMILIRVDPEKDDEFVPYTTEIMFPTNGEHVIEAKAVDKVGNESNVATFSVFVDSIPPKTKIKTAPATQK